MFVPRLVPCSHKVRRWAVRAAVTALALSLLLVVAAYCFSWVIPLPARLIAPADLTLVLEDRSGKEIAIVPSGRARASESLPLADMGHWLPNVTVELEDRRFWSHSGVDLKAVAGSAWRNLRAGRVVSGGSTIAQQLIKNSYDHTRHRWLDKLYEILAAVRLTRSWSRERILEEYLNRLDYGNRLVGPRAAARAYFGKEPADLTISEALYLAGLPQAPTRLNPWLRPEAAARRYRRSLGALVERGVISRAAMAALGDGTPLVQRRYPLNEAPHFVDAVVARWGGLHGSLRTTLDLGLQREVANLVSQHVHRLQGRGVGQAAVVIVDNRDGSVRAMVGSADYWGSGGQINGTLLPRSCGSVLKPFLYVEAIERRLLTAASILPDTPDAIRGEYLDYDPRDFDERYLGPVRVREALANSLNVPAVYTLKRVGAHRFFDRLDTLGFHFPRNLRDYGAGLILGNAEPRLVDLAAAFAGIACKGRVPTWRLLEAEPKSGRLVANPEATSIVADILCDDDARRHSFGRGSPLAVPVRVPCKTGTSSGFRDAWTVGSTAQHTVAVWAGNFDGRPMNDTASIEAAAPLWRDVVDLLLEKDDGVPPPVAGSGLTACDVCRLTGRRPTEASPGVVREWFLAGSEPVENAGVWVRTEAGRRIITLPPEYAKWCASPYNYLGATASPERAIAIRTPASGATYVIDHTILRSQQWLSLEAAFLEGEKIEWTVNGQIVPATNGAYFWPMQPGDCTAVVTDGVRRAEVHFKVVP